MSPRRARLTAGALRHRVTIEQATESLDGFGQVAKTWDTFATVWAVIEPLSGSEYLQARQQQAVVTTRIRIRYLDGVTERMRAKWGGHVYDIQAVLADPTDKREMVLMCNEVVS